MLELPTVDILDTSALVEFKRAIGVSAQWAAFRKLEERVAQGLIAMPRQVINEVSAIAHPDMPGAWAPGMRRQLRHPIDVDYSFVSTVMTVAGDVVDASATGKRRTHTCSPLPSICGVKDTPSGL